MRFRYRAAIMMGDEVVTGTSHLDICERLGDELARHRCRHGYADLDGNFFDTIHELTESMRESILIRHAESLYNKELTENLDSELTELGSKQAVGVANYLQESGDAEGFVGLVSPYRRCLQTALPIHKATGINFKVMPELCEYGATWSKVQYHIFVPERRNEYPMFDWSLYRHGQLFTAETYSQFLDRVRKVLKSDLPEKMLVVSHGAVVYTLVDLLCGGNVIEEGYRQVTNASVSKIVGGKPIYTFKNEWKGDNQ